MGESIHIMAAGDTTVLVIFDHRVALTRTLDQAYRPTDGVAEDGDHEGAGAGCR